MTSRAEGKEELLDKDKIKDSFERYEVKEVDLEAAKRYFSKDMEKFFDRLEKVLKVPFLVYLCNFASKRISQTSDLRITRGFILKEAIDEWLTRAENAGKLKLPETIKSASKDKMLRSFLEILGFKMVERGMVSINKEEVGKILLDFYNKADKTKISSWWPYRKWGKDILPVEEAEDLAKIVASSGLTREE